MATAGTAPLYREFFSPDERRLLDSAPIESALSEIYLYRHLLRRLFAALRTKTSLSLRSHISLLAALSGAGLILSSLVRFHWHVTISRGAFSDELLAMAALDGEPL